MAYINDTVRCCFLRDDAVERIKHVAEKVSHIPFTIIVKNRKFFLIAFSPKKEETIIFQQRTGKHVCCLRCEGYEIFSHGDEIEEAILKNFPLFIKM